MKSQQPLISVVMVNYNGSQFIPGIFESINKQSYSNYEIIVVDNASTDNSPVLIKDYFKKDLRAINTLLIRSKKNVGFALGNNLGVARAKGEYILFVNTDITFEPDMIKRLVDSLRPSIFLAGVAPKIYLSRFLPQKVFDSIGICIDYTSSPYNRGIGQVDLGQYDVQEEIMGLCFACCLVRKRVFELLDGLDPSYFAYFEDVDWSIRARKSGYWFKSCPEATAYHYHSGTTNQQAYAWKYYLIFRNYLRTVVKSLGKRNSMHIILRKCKDFTKAVINPKTTSAMKRSMIKVLLNFWLLDWWRYLAKRPTTQIQFIPFFTDEMIFKYSVNEPSSFFDPVTLQPKVGVEMMSYILKRVSSVMKRPELTRQFKEMMHFYYCGLSSKDWERRWQRLIKEQLPQLYKEAWVKDIFKLNAK